MACLHGDFLNITLLIQLYQNKILSLQLGNGHMNNLPGEQSSVQHQLLYHNSPCVQKQNKNRTFLFWNKSVYPGSYNLFNYTSIAMLVNLSKDKPKKPQNIKKEASSLSEKTKLYQLCFLENIPIPTHFGPQQSFICKQTQGVAFKLCKLCVDYYKMQEDHKHKSTKI